MALAQMVVAAVQSTAAILEVVVLIVRAVLAWL